eukprot:9543186-Prorocentrum_lima.AAC.1
MRGGSSARSAPGQKRLLLRCRPQACYDVQKTLNGGQIAGQSYCPPALCRRLAGSKSGGPERSMRAGALPHNRR